MTMYNRYIRLVFLFICLAGTLLAMREIVKAANAHQFKNTVEERALAVRALIVDGKAGTPEKTRGLKNYLAAIDTDLSVYGSSGRLVFSTTQSPKTIKLPVSEAIYQETDGHYVYTSQLPGKDRYYIRLNGGLPQNTGAPVVYLVLFILGAALILYYDRTVRYYTGALDEAATMADRLSHGEYSSRTSETVKNSNASKLNYSLNVLARNLERMERSYYNQQDRLQTLIENLGSGLIFINASGHIVLVNKTYRETFRVNTDIWTGEKYQDVLPNPEVIDLISETYLTETRRTKQFDIGVHINRKHFDVSSVPIINLKGHIRGVVVLFHDITELKKLEQMRRDFVANVSHELKTPITSLIGFAETLLDGAMEDRELSEKFLNIILNEGKRLQSLISDLLELSKIEEEHFKLNWETINLKPLAEETVLILGDQARGKSISIHESLESDVFAAGDSYRIRQIMMNIIANAIAYTPRGGEVTVAVRETEKYAQFIVTDTGIGIDKGYIPRIFERFYRMDKARSREGGGTGLGLAIVKHLVEAHAGEIDVDSEVGRGTSFVISFKKAGFERKRING